jgi:oligopeptide/dipeptide ABC transporter ATP-binding protein
MYGGRVMEAGPVERILTAPEHPYTRALLECSVRDSSRDERVRSLDGRPPDSVGGHEGCPFADRCRHVTATCREGSIPMTERDADHRLACPEVPFSAARASSQRQEAPMVDGGRQHDTE